MTPRPDLEAAMKWANQQITENTTGWTNQCQRFSRTVWGMPVMGDSALHAWEKIAARYKVTKLPLTAAPRGAILYYNLGTFGHACIASTPKQCITTDYVRRDKVNQAPRSLPNWGGAAQLLGWAIGAQFYDLNGGFFVGVGE